MVTERWEHHLRHCESIKKSFFRTRKQRKAQLRFGRSCVIVSDVAQQYYCEKKVEMQYLYGRVETEGKLVGSEAHEKLVEDAVEVKPDDLWRQIYDSQGVVALEMSLLAFYEDLALAGKADGVLFKGGEPLVLLEYKFTHSKMAYPSYHVQASTYGLILENMGFNTSNLRYAIVVADPRNRGNTKLREEALEAIIGNDGSGEGVIRLDDAVVYVEKFDLARAEERLDWAIGYWLNRRDATRSENSHKCGRCEYHKECLSS